MATKALLRAYTCIGVVTAATICASRGYLCARFGENPIIPCFAGVGYGILWPCTIALSIAASPIHHHRGGFTVRRGLAVFTPSINPRDWGDNSRLVAFLAEKGVVVVWPKLKMITNYHRTGIND